MTAIQERRRADRLAAQVARAMDLRAARTGFLAAPPRSRER
jgi:hypothetical protein